MSPRLSAAKGHLVRSTGAAVAAARRRRAPATYRRRVTVVTVSWNSLPFLQRTLAAVRAMSPVETEILVVDNGSSDGSADYLRARTDTRSMLLPVNVGHGVALDLAMAELDTEYVAVLDVDAFPISPEWLPQSIAALDAGAQVAGAHLHRNFVHPCFLVTRPPLLHRYGLTFRPVGSLTTLPTAAPLFLDVGEALAQRVIVKFGGGRALHFFEITSVRGPGMAGAVFGGLVYHNMYATQGKHQREARAVFCEEFDRHHPRLALSGPSGAS
jgi:glycosyltransferase involved in cell wall biosynthesis